MIVGVKLLDGSLTQVNLDDKIVCPPSSLQIQHEGRSFSAVLRRGFLNDSWSRWYEELDSSFYLVKVK